MKPNALPLRRFALVSLLAAATFSGCDDRRITGPAIETEDPNYIEGKRLASEQRNAEALECFTKVILSRRSAPESHLEAGNLCLDTAIKDPLEAVFHFKQYVKQSATLMPQRKTWIEGRIRAAEKDFLRDPSLPFRPAEGAGAGDDALLEQIKQLRAENDMLKRRQTELVAAAARPAPVAIRNTEDTSSAPAPAASTTVSAAVVPPPAASPPAPSGHMRKYVIAPGDTLVKISRKVYGAPNKWQKILNANPDKLPSQNAKLKVGDELKIPE